MSGNSGNIIFVFVISWQSGLFSYATVHNLEEKNRASSFYPAVMIDAILIYLLPAKTRRDTSMEQEIIDIAKRDQMLVTCVGVNVCFEWKSLCCGGQLNETL